MECEYTKGSRGFPGIIFDQGLKVTIKLETEPSNESYGRSPFYDLRICKYVSRGSIGHSEPPQSLNLEALNLAGSNRGTFQAILVHRAAQGRVL